MDEALSEYEDPIIKNGFSDLKAAILTGRTDIVRTILAAAQSYRDEDALFDGEEENAPGNKKEEEEGEILDLLQLLLNFKDHDAGTPLHYATKLGRADMVRALLSAGANPTIQNNDGSTPYDYCKSESVMNAYVGELMQAAAQSKMFRLKQILSAGVNINSGDGADSDNKVLHWAVSFGSFDMVKLVLDKGADIDALNGDGATPLHDAVIRGDEEILAELLRRGADISVSPYKGPLEGKKPYELALDKPWLQKVFHDELHAQPSTVNGYENHVGNAETNHNGQHDVVTPGGTDNNLRYDRKAKQDEEIILVSDENTKEGGWANLFSPKRGHTGRQTSSVLLTPKMSPVQPYFPTIVKVDNDVSFLWPQPQKVSQYKGAFYVPPLELTVIIISTERFQEGAQNLVHIKEMWDMVKPNFKTLGFDLRIEIHSIGSEYSFQKGAIYCSLDSLVFLRSEEYKLNITTDKVNIIAKDTSSMFHAIWTFLQCIRIYQGKGIPLWQIHDWPSFGIRGVILDFHEGFLPDQRLLMNVIDTVSQFKPSQIYVPVNLFLQRDGQSAPYSRRDLMDLLGFCTKRFMDVVPLVRISSYQQRETITQLLQFDIFCLFPMSRYILFEVEEDKGTSTGERNIEKASDPSFDLWSLILDLHQTCTSSGRAIIIDAGVVLKFPQRLPRLPHGLICAVNCQYADLANNCERLNDLGIPYVVCPQLVSSSRKGVATHVCHVQDIIRAASSYDSLGVLVRCDMDVNHLAFLTFSTITLGYSIGHAWNCKELKENVASTMAGVVNRHILQDQNDLFGPAFVALMSMSSGAKSPHPYLDVLDTTILQKITEGTEDVMASRSHLPSLQESMVVFKRCVTIAKSADLLCRETNFVVRETHVLCTLLIFLCKLYKSLIVSGKGDVLSVDNLTAVQRSDMSNKLLNLVEQYKSFYHDNFLRGYGRSYLNFLQELLRTLHPTTANAEDKSKGIKTI